uniref:catenin delta-2-like n=1 Tax=Myxine glutinosa TaxID=7769 RepID=UPI00358EE0EB
MLETMPLVEDRENVDQGVGDCSLANHTEAILASVKEQELQYERLTAELEAERLIVADQLGTCKLQQESATASMSSISSTDESLNWKNASGPTGEVSEDEGRVSIGSELVDSCIRNLQERGIYDAPESNTLSAKSQSYCKANSSPDSCYQEMSSSYQTNHTAPLDELGLDDQHLCEIPIESLNQPYRNQPHTVHEQPGMLQACPALDMKPWPMPSVYARSASLSHTHDQHPFMPGSSGLTKPSVWNAYAPVPMGYHQGKASPFDMNESYARRGLRPANLGNGNFSWTPSPVSPGSHQYESLPESSPNSRDAVAPPSAMSIACSGTTSYPQPPSGPMAYPGMLVSTHTSTTSPSQCYGTVCHGSPALRSNERALLTRHGSLPVGVRAPFANAHPATAEPRFLHSPERRITPIYEGQVYRSPDARAPGRSHADYLSACAVQRSSSQRSACSFQNYERVGQANYTEPYPPLTRHPSTEHRQGRLGGHGPASVPGSRQYTYMALKALTQGSQMDGRGIAWRNPDLGEVVQMLQHQQPSVQANAAAYLQHLCYRDTKVKSEVRRLGGIAHLVELLSSDQPEVRHAACGALRNLSFGGSENKAALRVARGLPVLAQLLQRDQDHNMQEVITGLLWNLSSCEDLKMPIINSALTPLTNTIILPLVGLGSATTDSSVGETQSPADCQLLRNSTGCLRNVCSAGEEARKNMRECEGLVEALLRIIKNSLDNDTHSSKVVENCVCVLRNLSYRLSMETPGAVETGNETGSSRTSRTKERNKERSCCWGKKRKKKPQEEWDGTSPLPECPDPPQGAEQLWHPSVASHYLGLLKECSNPATLEGAAGALQNLSAGNWKWAAYVCIAVRKEKGLPVLVELLQMDNERVVCAVAGALRNMAMDVRNKELIGKYAMGDLVRRLPKAETSEVADEAGSQRTVAAVCMALGEVATDNMENAKALRDVEGIGRLINLAHNTSNRYPTKVAKVAAQVLNTLWQYKDLRPLYKKDGWSQQQFIVPGTVERSRTHARAFSQPSSPPRGPTLARSLSVGSTPSSQSATPNHRVRNNADYAFVRSASERIQSTTYKDSTRGSRPSPSGTLRSSLASHTADGAPPRQTLNRRDTSMRSRDYDTLRATPASRSHYEDSYLDDRLFYTGEGGSVCRATQQAPTFPDMFMKSQPMARGHGNYETLRYQDASDSWV